MKSHLESRSGVGPVLEVLQIVVELAEYFLESERCYKDIILEGNFWPNHINLTSENRWLRLELYK